MPAAEVGAAREEFPLRKTIAKCFVLSNTGEVGLTLSLTRKKIDCYLSRNGCSNRK